MAKKTEDLVGRKFNRLLVVSFNEERSKKGKKYWFCQCECGNLKTVRADSLRDGSVQSCGCLMKEQAKKPKGERRNLVGLKFGRLTVISKKNASDRGYVWRCVCDCGKTKDVITNRLNSGKTSSCGCLSVELSTKRIKEVSERNVGKNHYLYNENLTDEERQDKRDTKENVKWRESIYKRDKYTCVRCGKMNVKLNAHHLNSYANFPEQRFVLENGVTLCVCCHKQFHKEYTNFNNTKEQFIEFMDNTEINK